MRRHALSGGHAWQRFDGAARGDVEGGISGRSEEFAQPAGDRGADEESGGEQQ